MRLISVDSGINGAIARFNDRDMQEVITMPVTKVETQSKLEQFWLDSAGKKVTVASGPNKGKFKMKLRRAAKYKNMLDVSEIYDMFEWADHIVLEKQQPMIGNAASSSFTIGLNYGRLLALAELSGTPFTEVMPVSWKKAMHITMSKDEKLALGGDKKLITHTLKAKSCALAKKLTGANLVTSKGRMLHDEAEAILIGLWYIDNG